MKLKIHEYRKNSFKNMSKKLIYALLFFPLSFISNAQITNDSLAKRDAMIDRNIEELIVLRDIAKDLVKTDIEQGKSIIVMMGDLKELRHRIEVLERSL